MTVRLFVPACRHRSSPGPAQAARFPGWARAPERGAGMSLPAWRTLIDRLPAAPESGQRPAAGAPALRRPARAASPRAARPSAAHSPAEAVHRPPSPPARPGHPQPPHLCQELAQHSVVFRRGPAAGTAAAPSRLSPVHRPREQRLAEPAHHGSSRFSSLHAGHLTHTRGIDGPRQSLKSAGVKRAKAFSWVRWLTEAQEMLAACGDTARVTGRTTGETPGRTGSARRSRAGRRSPTAPRSPALEVATCESGTATLQQRLEAGLLVGQPSA